jgi:hypothetical protein
VHVSPKSRDRLPHDSGPLSAAGRYLVTPGLPDAAQQPGDSDLCGPRNMNARSSNCSRIDAAQVNVALS